MHKVYLIGDIHGDFDMLSLQLQKHNLMNFEGKWLGNDSTLIFIGDLTDRWHQGIEVIKLVMSLEKQAQQVGGKVISLCGNHDALILARAYQYRGEILDRDCEFLFEYNGGYLREAISLSQDDEMFVWMQKRPLMHKEGNNLFQHADTCLFYKMMGNTIENINIKGFDLLSTGDGSFNLFCDMCDNRYWDQKYYTKHSEVESRIDEYLKQFDVKRIFHGHTRFIGTEPVVYYNEKIINVDGSLSKGYRKDFDRGFIVEIHNAFTD